MSSFEETSVHYQVEEDSISTSNIEAKISELFDLSSKSNNSRTSRHVTFFDPKSDSTYSCSHSNVENETLSLMNEEPFCEYLEQN